MGQGQVLSGDDDAVARVAPLGAFPMYRGALVARLAEGAQDIGRALALREQVFRRDRGLGGPDADAFDARCLHVLVEDHASGRLLCCYRLLLLAGGAAVETSYSAQFYDLAALRTYPGPMLELGRFCLSPGCGDPDVLRLAWAAMTRIVDGVGAKMLFGCSSFQGADPDLHRAGLGCLAPRYLAPPELAPRRRAPAFVPLEPAGPGGADWAGVPALLRSYLAMGGWVSDHAVIDPELDTLHVFTAVEISRIPAARSRAMRMMAQN